MPRHIPKVLRITSEVPLRGAGGGIDYRVIKASLGDRMWSPDWATEHTLGLLRGIVLDAAPERAPLLADALEEAGASSDEPVVASFRDGGEEAERLLAYMAQAALAGEVRWSPVPRLPERPVNSPESPGSGLSVGLQAELGQLEYQAVA